MSRLSRTGCSVYSWARPPGCAPDRDSVGSDALSAAMSRSRRERHASRAVPTRVVGCVEVDEASAELRRHHLRAEIHEVPSIMEDESTYVVVCTRIK